MNPNGNAGVMDKSYTDNLLCLLCLLICVYHHINSQIIRLPNVIRYHEGKENRVMQDYDERWLRMRKERFLELVSLLSPYLETRPYNRNVNGDKISQNISPFIIVFIGVRYLSGGSYLDLVSILSDHGHRFARSTFYYCNYKFAEAVLACPKLKINFYVSRISQYAQGFRDRYPDGDFPEVFGVVDGSEIEVFTSNEQKINRKMFKSMKLIAICDADSRFIFTHIDPFGSRHDSYSFKQSVFYKGMSKISEVLDRVDEHIFTDPLMKREEAERVRGKFLLADKAFAVERFLIKALSNPEEEEEEEEFNRQLAKRRVRIEHAFGELKGVFGVLSRPMKTNDINRRMLIDTCCCLHNFIVDDFIKMNKGSDEERIKPFTEVQMKRYNETIEKIKENRNSHNETNSVDES